MKIFKLRIALLIVATLISATLYFWVQNQQKNLKPEKEIVMSKSEDFGSEHFNQMKVDTFVKLVMKAYQPNVTTSFNNNQLKVQIMHANEATKDFINGNDKLLQAKNKDFEIDHDKLNNNITCTFKIKDSLIIVPNDILIQLVYKNFN